MNQEIEGDLIQYDKEYIKKNEDLNELDIKLVDKQQKIKMAKKKTQFESHNDESVKTKGSQLKNKDLDNSSKKSSK